MRAPRAGGAAHERRQATEQPSSSAAASRDQVLIARIPKNAREELRVELSTYNGHNLASVRVYAKLPDGACLPTKKGIAVKVTALDRVLEALCEAQAEARRRGWLVP